MSDDRPHPSQVTLDPDLPTAEDPRTLLTSTALVTLDAVMEHTGAALDRVEVDAAGLAAPVIAARLRAPAGATTRALGRALRDVERRGLLRGLVRAPRMVWVADRRIQTSPFLRIVLVFRRAAAAKHVAQSTKC
jgi:hypothetical protein